MLNYIYNQEHLDEHFIHNTLKRVHAGNNFGVFSPRDSSCIILNEKSNSKMNTSKGYFFNFLKQGREDLTFPPVVVLSTWKTAIMPLTRFSSLTCFLFLENQFIRKWVLPPLTINELLKLPKIMPILNKELSSWKITALLLYFS